MESTDFSIISTEIYQSHIFPHLEPVNLASTRQVCLDWYGAVDQDQKLKLLLSRSKMISEFNVPPILITQKYIAKRIVESESDLINIVLKCIRNTCRGESRILNLFHLASGVKYFSLYNTIEPEDLAPKDIPSRMKILYSTKRIVIDGKCEDHFYQKITKALCMTSYECKNFMQESKDQIETITINTHNIKLSILDLRKVVIRSEYELIEGIQQFILSSQFGERKTLKLHNFDNEELMTLSFYLQPGHLASKDLSDLKTTFYTQKNMVFVGHSPKNVEGRRLGDKFTCLSHTFTRFKLGNYISDESADKVNADAIQSVIRNSWEQLLSILENVD